MKIKISRFGKIALAVVLMGFSFRVMHIQYGNFVLALGVLLLIISFLKNLVSNKGQNSFTI